MLITLSISEASHAIQRQAAFARESTSPLQCSVRLIGRQSLKASRPLKHLLELLAVAILQPSSLALWAEMLQADPPNSSRFTVLEFEQADYENFRERILDIVVHGFKLAVFSRPIYRKV